VNTRRFLFTCPALWLALLVAGCGGGGGGSNNVPSGLVITSIQVTTQPTGSQSPFGTANGGDTIQIGGSGFVLNLKVFFSGVEAVVLTVGTGAVTCRSPAGAEGAATITVRNPDGATASSSAFQYIAPPVIVSLKATTGPTAEEARAPIDGNETIEVAGQNFKPGIGGSVDGINVVVTFVNSQTIRFQAPATPFEKGATVIGQ